MSTTLPEKTPSRAPTVPTSSPTRAKPPVKKSGWKWLVLLLGGGGVASAVWLAPRISGVDGTDVDKKQLLHEVQRGDMLVTVTEEGNVESASNLEIKCQVAGGSSILWIVDDGTQVQKGDKLFELDSSTLEDSINTQRIAFEKARSLKIQSEKTYAVAKISVTEYLEGTYIKALQDADTLVTIAEENLRSAKNALEHGEKMFRKGYVSSLELESQRFAVQRCDLELGSAKTARDVLVNFTKEKTVQDLASQRDNAEAQKESDAAAFELEQNRLQRLEDQLKNCVVTAPQAGMAVYANERGGRFGQAEATIEEGATVRERQTILRLPDLSQMQVKVNVHESKVDQIRPGMRARIRILDRELTGHVTSIANQPEPTSFFSGNVKEYATRVRVDDQGSDSLRPGMTAEVEILVAHIPDAISLPVAAVVDQRGKFFAWVKLPSHELEKRPLVLGNSNEKFVEVKDGVAAGETVILNPRAVIDEARLSPEAEAKQDGTVQDRFGAERKGTDADGKGDASKGGPMGSADASKDKAGENRADGSGGGRKGSGRPDLAQLDKDGDGKISKDEAPEPMRNFFDRIDANSDGFLDRSEMNAMRRPNGAGPGGESSGSPRGE